MPDPALEQEPILEMFSEAAITISCLNGKEISHFFRGSSHHPFALQVP